MVVRGRYRSDEAILAWSEIGRTKGLFGSLGGLSGAPVMDKDGKLISSGENAASRKLFAL